MTKLHDKRFPGESEAYRKARNNLLEAEIKLRSQVEEVAALRRTLPRGGGLKEDEVFHEEDLVFQEYAGPARNDQDIRETRFSDLFAPGKDTLVIYSWMFHPDHERPCTASGSYQQLRNRNQQEKCSVPMIFF